MSEILMRSIVPAVKCPNLHLQSNVFSGKTSNGKKIVVTFEFKKTPVSLMDSTSGTYVIVCLLVPEIICQHYLVISVPKEIHTFMLTSIKFFYNESKGFIV